MEDLTIILSAITLTLAGFVSGMAYTIIKNLSNRLAKYERREELLNQIVDRNMKRMNGEDNE